MTMSARVIPLLIASVAVAACSTESPGPASLTAPPSANSRTKSTSNPTATWEFPVSDAGLSVKSDHTFLDGTGTYSVYANGVCSVSSTIFYGGSGDNTIQFSYPKGKSCGRTWTVDYPDGYSETLAYAGGVQVLENSSYSIPIGETVLRHFRFGAASNGNPFPSRCSQGLVFGPGGANPAPGSDSVWVHRVDASTWDVYSQAPPNDYAYCVDNQQTYEMQVSFRMVSSSPLP